MKQGAIFDMDGLLFDTERLYKKALADIAVEFGLIANPVVSEVTRGSGGDFLRQALQHYYPTVDADAYIRRMRAYVQELTKNNVPEKPGIREILGYLHSKNVKIAVASSSPYVMIERYLHLAKIQGYFDAVVSLDEVRRSKPAPDIFLTAARKLRLKTQDCYVFEDSHHGVRAASLAGCSPVMIPDLSEPTDEIRQLCVGVYINLLEALTAIQLQEI